MRAAIAAMSSAYVRGMVGSRKTTDKERPRVKQHRVPLELFRVAVAVSRKPFITRQVAEDAVRASGAPLVVDGQVRSLSYVADVVHDIAWRVHERRENRLRLKAQWASRPGIGARLPAGSPASRLQARRRLQTSPLLRLIEAAERDHRKNTAST